jgi:hypothetical protein
MVRFREVQKFRQWWLWALLMAVALGLIAVFGYGMITQLVFGHTWGNRPLSDTALSIVGPLMILMGAGLVWLLYTIRLQTEVREGGVYIHFYPLAKQTVRFDEIAGCEVRTYRPIREYGGWGVRFGRAGKAYNIAGNRGVQLKLSNGKGLLIGSQRPEELARAIQDGMKG